MNIARRALTQSRKAVQKGFTLIELAIVGLFLGLLAIFAITQFTGGATDQTKANALVEASAKVTDAWSLVAQNCGLGAINLATTAGADITLGTAAAGTADATADNNLNALAGLATVHADYLGSGKCFTATGLKPMTGLAVDDPAAGGAVLIQGFPANVRSSTATNVVLTFSNVPAAVGNLVTQKLGTVATYTGTTLSISRPQ